MASITEPHSDRNGNNDPRPVVRLPNGGRRNKNLYLTTPFSALKLSLTCGGHVEVRFRTRPTCNDNCFRSSPDGFVGGRCRLPDGNWYATTQCDSEEIYRDLSLTVYETIAVPIIVALLNDVNDYRLRDYMSWLTFSKAPAHDLGLRWMMNIDVDDAYPDRRKMISLASTPHGGLFFRRENNVWLVNDNPYHDCESPESFR